MKKNTAKKIINRMGMNWDEDQRQEFLDGIKVVELKRLEEPYPVNDYFTADTVAGKEQWDEYWYGRPLKDKRYNKGERRKTLLLDESRLQYKIPQDESVIFKDAATKEIFMIVLRNFFPDEKIRNDFVSTCREIIKVRRDDRREDPGQLVHFGYTCGSRHDPEVGLAKNCRKLKPKAHRELNDASQGMAGIGWNMLRGRLPQEIIDDYNDTVKKIGYPRMDMMKTGDNTFAYEIGGQKVTFNEDGKLQLPPPSGLSAINYARFTHRENNGNKWFVAVTCQAAEDPSIGGNFLNGSYGVLMLAASNTVTAFCPSDYHGTTLYEIILDPWPRDNYEKRPDGGENIGFAFEVSKGLMNAKRKGDQKNRNKPGRGGPRKRRLRWVSDAESGSDSEYLP